MKRFALISDVHGNLEALEAVLRDVDTQNPDMLVVLGDTINYGPNPRECLTLLAVHADILLAGNHEKEAALPIADDLEDDAREMLTWTLSQVAGLRAWERLRSAILDEGADAAQRRMDGLHFVHASARRPYEQYVWPGHPQHHLHLNDQLDLYLGEILSGFDATHSFVGHTHAPAVLTEYANYKIFPVSPDWNRRLTFTGPSSIFYVPSGECRVEDIAGRKMVLNPGSVGQPRDGDPRASWAFYDGTSITFRRVPYDHASTAAKIRALPLSADTRTFFSDRLALGR